VNEAVDERFRIPRNLSATRHRIGLISPITMSFSLEQFYRANQRVLIWVLLAALLWLLRGFFGLMFVVYVLVLLVLPTARAVHRRLRIPERLALVAVYVVLLLGMAGFVRFVTPSVVTEINHLVANLGSIQTRLIDANEHFAERYPSLQAPMLGYLRSSLQGDVRQQFEQDLTAEAARLGLPEGAARSPARWNEVEGEDPASRALVHFEQERLLGSLFQELSDAVRKRAPQAVTLLYHGVATLMLGMIFSFLILVDLRRLTAFVEGLRRSRLRDFYEQAGPPIAQLGASIGVGIRAQAIIAAINALLTTVGLAILGVPSIAMLALIVFICGFVPIVGMFASTLPMLLVAINVGGAKLALGTVAMVVVVHLVESYLLNPFIYGAGFKFNPVLTLMILFIGHHAFGIWGMLLGLPVARYFLADVFAVPLESAGAASSHDAEDG
jgi:predicted PurR-regulated permease PerM